MTTATATYDQRHVHIRSPRRLTGMLCALTNGRVSSLKLALFGAPPPQATQTLPRLSLCLHACAESARELPRVSALSDAAHRDARAPRPAPTHPTTRPGTYLAAR